MDTIKIENLQYLYIGVQGTHNAETVPIDMTSWVEEFAEKEIDGVSYYILFKPYDSLVALPVVTEWTPDEDNILRWTITLNNTYTAGVGYAEVRAVRFTSVENNGLELGLVKKSKVIPVTVDHSVNAESGVDGGTVPAPYEDWVNLVLATEQRLNSMFEGAVTEYQGSLTADEIPSGTWLSDPDEAMAENRFLWSRITFEWATGAKSYFYTVSYLGLEAAGVRTVNNKSGVVTLLSDDIKVSAEQDAESVQDALDRIEDAVSDVETDVGDLQTDVGDLQTDVGTLQTNVTGLQSNKLDASKIVYNQNEPAKVAGTIWLKPKS